VAKSPQLVRRLAHASRHMRVAPGIGGGMGVGHRRRRHHHGLGSFGGSGTRGYRGGMGGGLRRRGRGIRGWGGAGGGARSLSFSGPVRISIEPM
jgi:hypothetical protein